MNVIQFKKKEEVYIEEETEEERLGNLSLKELDELEVKTKVR